jgi:hypothetical protein
MLGLGLLSKIIGRHCHGNLVVDLAGSVLNLRFLQNLRRSSDDPTMQLNSIESSKLTSSGFLEVHGNE